MPNAAEKRELRLAALFHDCGHGPFSHASEDVYGRYELFDELRKERADLFKNPKNVASEILSFFIVTSKPFKDYFDKVRDLYSDDAMTSMTLSRIDLDRVGLLILGKLSFFSSDRKKYLDQIINGPFDVDKLDYIHRDGYFTGLGTSVDLDRLFETVHVFTKHKKNRLAVDASGVTALEQLVFNKMLIFSVVYHHHKVRSAALAIRNLFKEIIDRNWTIKGLRFESPFDFLQVDDPFLLVSLHSEDNLNKSVDVLRNRELSRVAVVLGHRTVEDDESRLMLLELTERPDDVEALRDEIAERAGVPQDRVHLDLPAVPRFRAITMDAFVTVAPGEHVELETIYPTSGWASAYVQNRYKAYVFCPRENTEKVAKASLSVLHDYGVRLKRYAFDLAKHQSSFVEELVGLGE